MVKSSSGLKRDARHKLKKGKRHKFKVNPYLQQFRPGDRVVLEMNPSSQKGMPFTKFKGRTGEIREKRGRSYVVDVKIGEKTKKIISRPEHLVPEGR